VKPRASDQDLFRVVRLLETLRHEAAVVDVEAAVAHRIRLLGVPRLSAATVSLPQFGWAAAVAVFGIVIGALCVAGILAPGAGVPASAGSIQGLAVGVGSVVLAAARGLARSFLRGALETAGRFSGAAPYLDHAMVLAGQAALVVCVAVIALTVLVVHHEVRSRRFSA